MWGGNHELTRRRGGPRRRSRGRRGGNDHLAHGGEIAPARYAQVVPRPDGAVELLAQARFDAIAMARESLIDFSKKLPSTRLLDDIVQTPAWSWWFPRTGPERASGQRASSRTRRPTARFRRALDGAGFTNAPVAPPEAKR